MPNLRVSNLAPDFAPNAAAPGPDSRSGLDEHLRELDVHLERLNRLASMGAVTGMIAHEFNNILTPILSYAQMALEEPGNAALSVKALERTVAGAERAARIAEAILNFVRDQGGPGGGGVGGREL